MKLHPIKFNGKPQPLVPAPTPQSQNKMTSCYPESLQDSTDGLNLYQATKLPTTHTYIWLSPNEWLVLLLKNPVSKGTMKTKYILYSKHCFSQEVFKLSRPELPGRLLSWKGIPFMIVTRKSAESCFLFTIPITTLTISTLHETCCTASSTHIQHWTHDIHWWGIWKGNRGQT